MPDRDHADDSTGPASGLDVTFLRPHAASRAARRADFGLPPDLLAQARRRVAVLGALVAVGAGADLIGTLARLFVVPAAEVIGFPQGIPFFGSLGSTLIGLVLFVGARSRIGNRRLLTLALLTEVLLCAVISISNPLALFLDSGTLPVLTWVTPLIILFPLLVPTPPRLTLVTAIAAAATAPLGLLFLASTGLIAATPDDYAAMAFSPTLATVIAYYSAQTVYRLGLAVAKARSMGSYRLERLLGSGGMGEVWMARHQMLARPAAVKLIRPELAQALRGSDAGAALQRFEREAQATAAMRSPHTVDLYDFGVAADGTFYYVMELLEGVNLDTLIRRFGPVPPERAIHLLGQACHSLAEAHESGLVHRDIKPANIFVCRYGRDVDFVKVLDFGLVKAFRQTERDDTALTAEHLAVGTPAYMSPEQSLGQSQDARSDLYALGCVAYWLLTGVPVFDGDSPMGIAVQHVSTPPVPMSKRTELPIPPALEGLILSCLAKDPAARPESAGCLADALTAIVLPDTWTETRARSWWNQHLPDDARS